jgi:hypothetical protein
LYESRWDQPGAGRREFRQPMWIGEPLAGRRLLLHAEQGFGDSIQFIRYAREIAARGGEVVLECPAALVALLRTAPGVRAIVASGDPLPPCDFHLPMLSQPLVFQTTRENVPAETPYLFAESGRREFWRQRLGEDRRQYRVGVAWAGNPHHRRSRQRDIALDALRPLFAVAGVDFCSLQIDHATGSSNRAPAIVDHTAALRDFADTAALISELDLVISVDTAVAHLAGALGRPVWTLLPFVPDWRWGLEGDHTPWYPTMRLFRQAAPGDWRDVVERVREALGQIVSARKPS